MIRASSEHIVRVGVIGLGRPWADRHRAALTRPGGRSRVVAVCDPVAHRAEAEADRLSCDAVEGLTALLDRPDVEAVFLLDDPWFGPWPLQAALDRGKAVYCTIGHRATLDELATATDSSNGRRDAPPVMTELVRRFSPETLRLRELLATELGPPRRITIKARASTTSPGLPNDRPTIGPPDAAVELLDWARVLDQAEPIAARLVARADRDQRALRIVDLEFPGERSARLTLLCRAATERIEGLGPTQLVVETDRGRAWVDRTGRLRWSIGEETIEERLPADVPTEAMVDHFLRLARGEQSLAPGIDELIGLDRLARVFEL